LEDQRDYAVSLFNDLEQNIAMCRADPCYGFYVHELSYLKPYFDTHPTDREFLREMVRQGRVGTGGSYNQPAEKLIGPEGLLRNIIYGRLFHERVLGDRPLVYTPWDVFGHCSQLSQILAKARFLGVVWSKPIFGFPPIFWHESLDGTRLLHLRRPYWEGGVRDRQQLLESARRKLAEMHSYGFSCDLRIDADDFKPPTAWLLGECASLAREKPRVIVSGQGHRLTFSQLRQEMEAGKIDVPATARDSEWHHQGTALTRIEFKIANRLAENALVAAEKFSTIAGLLGATYPEKALDKAWRQLLFNQHHDSISGPCCDRGYLDLMDGYREALELAAEAQSRALDYLGRAVETAKCAPGKDAIPVLVFNSLNWERRDVVNLRLTIPKGWKGFRVEDSRGQEASCEVRRVGRELEVTFVAEKVPSVGYKLYYVVRAEKLPPFPRRRVGCVVENDFFRVAVDPKAGGGIVSLFDKEAGRELIDRARGPANELWSLAEKPDRSEAPWEIWTTGEKVAGSGFAATVRVEAGPVSMRVVATGEFKDCTKVQDVILYRGVRRIDLVTRLRNYRGEHDLVVVSFPTTLRGLQPIYEERCGTVVGRPSNGFLDFRVKAEHNPSGCGLRAAYQWLGLGNCATLEFGEAESHELARVSLGKIALVMSRLPEVERAATMLQTALHTKGIFCTPFFDDCEVMRRRKLDPRFVNSTLPGELNEDLPLGTSFRISLDVGGKNRYTKAVLRQLDPSCRTAFRRQLRKDGFACGFGATVIAVKVDGAQLASLLLVEPTCTDIDVLRLHLELLASSLAGPLDCSPEELGADATPPVVG